MKKGLLIGLLLLAGCTQTSTKIDESIPANQMFTGMNTKFQKLAFQQQMTQFITLILEHFMCTMMRCKSL
ncbi:hypothetical protein AOC36_11705 (plasmid) [Erysipelothrix larvae]|uniref:Uncharacterized protein n=1 Tax=Erysipelothrix larvae TaxID=1514105 RepID=A0A120JU25_9FIRM|nr:hypothetical protein [Erysipelothrix larvae]AMC94695.1 hypothetical protein AOC36_11705 [Erysipelothrix larvae]